MVAAMFVNDTTNPLGYSTVYYPIFGVYEILDYYGYVMDTVVFGGSINGTEPPLMAWRDNDTMYWNNHTIAQVPYYKNNTQDGVFYCSIREFMMNIDYIEVAQRMPGYERTYVEVLNDDGLNNGFRFSLNASGEVYLGVEYYSPRMYPDACMNATTTYGVMALFTTTGDLISYTYMSDYMLFNYFEFDYLQKGDYILKVMSQYGKNATPDFTVIYYGQ